MKIVNVETKLVDKLIDECPETIEEVKLANITTMELHSFENENNYKYNSCRVYIVLMRVVFTIFTIGLWLRIMFLAFNLILIKKQKFDK